MSNILRVSFPLSLPLLAAGVATLGLLAPPAFSQPGQLFVQENTIRVEGKHAQSAEQMTRLRSALELCLQLGETRAAAELEAVMERLQRSMEASKPFDIEDRATRVQILRDARGILDRAGWETGAGLLASFLRVSDSITNNQPVEVQSAALEALGPLPDVFPKVVKALRNAAQLAAQQGDTNSVKRCHALAEFYVKREGLKAPGPNLEDRRQRLGVIAKAVQVTEAAGDLEAARELRRMLEFGKLQLEGASDARLSAAGQDLSMERYRQQLKQAQDLATQLGRHEDAQSLAALREFYRQRDQAPPQRTLARPIPTKPLEAELRALETQLEAIQNRIEHLARRLEERK